MAQFLQLISNMNCGRRRRVIVHKWSGVAAFCAPNGHLIAPSNGDGTALAHRPWAYVGGAAAGHGKGPWGVLRDAVEKPRARRSSQLHAQLWTALASSMVLLVQGLLAVQAWANVRSERRIGGAE